MKKQITAGLLAIALLIIPTANDIESPAQNNRIALQTIQTASSDILPAEEESSPQIENSEVYTVTAYCNCPVCCGKWYNPEAIGASGERLQADRSCAMPKDIPMGTVVEVKGYGVYIVEDRPADWIAEKYDGKIIDLFFENHQEALEFGKRKMEVIIWE